MKLEFRQYMGKPGNPFHYFAFDLIQASVPIWLNSKYHPIDIYIGRCDKNKNKIFTNDLFKDQSGDILQVYYDEKTCSFCFKMYLMKYLLDLLKNMLLKIWK